MRLFAHETYLDVTQSVDSDKFTGVERMVRGLYRALGARRSGLTPVVWDPLLRSFCHLRGAEQARLAAWRGSGESGGAKPEGGPVELWLRRRLRPAGRWFRRIHLKPGDSLILPEPVADSRLVALETDGLLSRSVAICHDVIPWEFARRENTGVPPYFDRYLRALSRTRKVICISADTRTKLEDAWSFVGVKRAPVEVVPWPIPFDGARPEPGAPDRPDRILCVSSINPRKNHGALLDALRLLRGRGVSFELILVGREGKDAGLLVQEIQGARAEGLPVVWRRHIAEDELHQEYQRCAFTVLPSLMEGFGLPILESLWHSRPCLVHQAGAMAELAAAGGCQTVDMRRPIEIADGIARMIHDRDTYARLVNESQKRVFKTWDQWRTEFIAAADLHPA